MNETVLLRNEIQEGINSYFNSNDEEIRKCNWTRLMLCFQLHINNPKLITFRIIRDKDSQEPILIFKNNNNNFKLLIPLFKNRIIKLKLSDFINTGVTTDILNDLTFNDTIFKVYNDRKLNRKPLLYQKS